MWFVHPSSDVLLYVFLAVLYSNLVSLSIDRRPGDIEGITDIFFEDFKNFPQAQELGEDSAWFVHEEMEKTWGDTRMAVLPEDEAQKWILGVMLSLYSFSGLVLLVPSKFVNTSRIFASTP